MLGRTVRRNEVVQPSEPICHRHVVTVTAQLEGHIYRASVD